MFRLMVGLGNPGAAYRYTRHNLGGLAVERMASYYQADWHMDGRWQARLATVIIDGQELVLMRPNVYMNNSGIVVGGWAGYYHVQPSDIVVLHDELDLTVGEVRGKLAGGLNGHNGLRSVTDSLGNDRSFARIRFGIGRPLPGEDIAGFVLSKLSSNEISEWQQQFDRLIAELPGWLASDGQSSLVIKPMMSS